MTDRKSSSIVLCGQLDDEGAKHARLLFCVLVRFEESSLLVEHQFVEPYLDIVIADTKLTDIRRGSLLNVGIPCTAELNLCGFHLAT